MHLNGFQVKIGRSRWLLFYLITSHIFTLGVIFLVGLTMQLKVFFAVIVMMSFIYNCRQYHWLNNPYAVSEIMKNDKDVWQINGEMRTKNVHYSLERSFVSRRILILYFKKENQRGKISVVIPWDSIEWQDFRQLTIFLKDPKTFQE